MKRYYKLFDLRALMSAFGALLLLASCSSYQYAGYDNDGIYSSSENGEAYTANDYEESYEDALYYKKLFSEKADEFANVPQEGAIFTDIENYSSTGAFDENMFLEDGLTYESGNAAWGSNPDRITVNVYQDPFNNPFYNPYIFPYYSGFYDPFMMPGFGYAYNPYGFGYGYGFGFANPYRPWWNRWGGYGYNNWGWGGFGYGYGYGYNQYPYYGGNGYYPNRNYRDVAYSASRRNTYSSNDRYSRDNNVEARNSRISGYTNNRNIRAARTADNDRTYRTRSTRVRSTANRPTTRRSEVYSRSSDNTRQVRSVRSTRSYNENSRVRSTRSSSNSGTYRSSSSSSRSSGRSSSGSSSSRSSRGRGN